MTSLIHFPSALVRSVILAAAILAVAGEGGRPAMAGTVLNTGTPTGTGAPEVLSSTQWLAGEFAITAGETNQAYQLSAYLSQGLGQVGDTFTFAIAARRRA